MFFSSTYFNMVFRWFSGGIGAGVSTGGAGGGFDVGLLGGGVNANFGLTTPFFSNTGYNQYINPYYKPTTYYTYTPSANNYYVPVSAAASPTVYPVSSIAASSPAGHYARTVPQRLLFPTYY